jgi:putative copper export protein
MICAKIAANLENRKRAPSMTTWQTLSSMLHLIAIAMWLGAIVFFLAVSGPAVNELAPNLALRTMNRARIGLEAISWFAIGLLLLTGIVNLLARLAMPPPTIGDSFAIVFGVKLFLFGAMLVHHCLQVFKYAPTIARLTEQLPQSFDAWPEPLLTYWRRWFLLLKINAALGPIVVLLGLALVKNQ